MGGAKWSKGAGRVWQAEAESGDNLQRARGAGRKASWMGKSSSSSTVVSPFQPIDQCMCPNSSFAIDMFVDIGKIELGSTLLSLATIQVIVVVEGLPI